MAYPREWSEVMDEAQLLRWAEQQGYTFRWEDDWDLGGSHADFYGPGSAYEDGEPDTCEVCDMLDANGDLVDSLGCIDDASDEYRREIEAGMARGVYPAWVKAQRRTRSTWRARKRTLRRPVAL